MNTININTRVAELSATLKPIKECDCSCITSDMLEEAEDHNSYNASFYIDGHYIKPCFEGDFQGCLIQKAGEFQVLRFYYICTRLEGLAWNEIPEDWEDPDAPDFPEMEILDTIEYRQLWFTQSEQHQLILNPELNSFYHNNETYYVKVDSVQPWAFEPRHRDFITQQVNEVSSWDNSPLEFFLSPCCEMLINKAPQLFTLINDADLTDKALRYYRTLRIALRHHYQLPDTEQGIRQYFDYLDMLSLKNLCLTEPRYVCPADFNTEYQQLFAERQQRLQAYQAELFEQTQLRELAMEEKDILTAEQQQPAFAEHHSWLFGISFEDDNFRYTSLDSVEAYRIEGKIMHHCIFRCEYYKKPYMLAMHITDHEGNRVATCTINLKRNKIDAIQPMCNDTGFFRNTGIVWQTTNDYKRIYNTLTARLHTFPQYNPQPDQQSTKAA